MKRPDVKSVICLKQSKKGGIRVRKLRCLKQRREEPLPGAKTFLKRECAKVSVFEKFRQAEDREAKR